MSDAFSGGRTPFDHVATGFAMVMSLAAVRLLDSLRPASSSPAGWWVSAAWVAQKLAALALSWWVFWWMRAVVTWTAPAFLWVLLAPATLFLQASALVTTEPRRIASWRAHFFETRRWFFTLEAAFVLHSVITSTLMRAVPAADPLRILQGFALCVSLVGIASARLRLHMLLAPLALVTQVVGLSYCFFTP